MKKLITPTKTKIGLNVHENMIVRISKKFSDHKKGLPEWIKNARAQYVRLEKQGKDYSKIPIIFNLSNKEVMCIDFGGGEPNIIEEHLFSWGNPESSKQGLDLENSLQLGGHGNGGKLYALAQFKKTQIYNYYKGKLTVWEIKNTKDKAGNDTFSQERIISSENVSLSQVLKRIGLFDLDREDRLGKNNYGISLDDIYDSIEKGELGLFCWKGSSPKDNKIFSNRTTQDSRRISNLVSRIANHKQSLVSVRERSIHVFIKNRLFIPNLSPDIIDFEETKTKSYNFPEELGDHKFNKTKKSVLTIKISKKVLTGDSEAHNSLSFLCNDESIASYHLSELLNEKSLSRHFVAEIDIPELKEYGCIDEDREKLVSNSISSLIRNWCRERLNELVMELRSEEKKMNELENLEDASELFNKFDQHFGSLLDEEFDTPVFDTNSTKDSLVAFPSDEVGGFGTRGGKIKNKGSGKRKGKIERGEQPSTLKKRNSNPVIRLSNFHEDPLNPGETYDLIERDSVINQRVDDVDFGIWWVNTQKPYFIKAITDLKKNIPLFTSLYQVIYTSHKLRRKEKETSELSTEDYEIFGFELLDNMFARLGDMGYDFGHKKSKSSQIREYIAERTSFTIPELSKTMNIDQTIINGYLNNDQKFITSSFTISKEYINGRWIKKYSRK